MRTLGQVSVIGVESRRKGMLRRSENIVHRLFSRQTCRARPNTHIHRARELYENIVPGHTVYDVECPDHSFRKFTNDGQYLICFSRNHQDLIVYRPRWLNYCVKGEETDQFSDLPSKSKKFESYFVPLYSVSLASGSDLICKDFFLATDNNIYGVFATTSVPDQSPPPAEGAVPGVPSIEKIAIFLVRLSDGHIVDERIYHDDYIHLSHNNTGVFLYDDLLAILSIRYQSIRILQIRETGRFVDVRTIGAFCREDDELVLNSQAQDEDFYIKNQAAHRKARGLPAQAEVSASKRMLTSQGNAWPLEWNLRLKHAVSAKGAHSGRSRGSRSANPQGPHSSNIALPSNSEDGVGSPDTRMNGLYGGIQGSDFDHYFRELFANMEDNGQSNGIVSGVPGLGDGEGRVNPGRHERPRSPLQSHVYGNGHHSSAVESRGGVAPPEHVYGSGIRVDGSTIGGGGHHAASGLLRYGRSYSSASGDSVERYAGGRGSPSVRYTSTTGTSSESCSRSDGGTRWDGSISGGGSISYGTGAGGNGSVSVQSTENNQLEYVVSSRSRIGLANVQQARPAEDNYVGGVSQHGANEWRTHHRENGHRSVGNGGSAAGPPHNSENRRTQGTAVYTPVTEETSRLNDRFLPSRFANERASASGERAAPSTGSPTRPSASHRDVTSNGNTARAGQAIVPPAPRSINDAETNGAPQRNSRDTEQASSPEESSQLLGGIKQRLLTFVYKGNWDTNLDPSTKAKRLARFYYHFQEYVDLVMGKVQFLDRYHLLIKFGSVEGVVNRNAEPSHTTFLALYNLETTEMLGFFQNSSEELLSAFENFYDHFRVAPRFPFYMNFISTSSNNVHVREQLRKQRVAGSSNTKNVVKRTLAWLPFNSQCQSPSVYFDQSLFHYDEKLISAMERHKPCMEHPIKFISRRKPNSLKFKINPGSENGAHDGSRSKRVASFVFHPIFPFAITIQQSYMQPSVINFHFRK
ncbi:de-etiolated-1 [Marchantia polymorpha subsp. ruderalis]|uniref:Light-mediated development protein DET1 n=1 Tax=Marchantia polymorpha TaxID=3197 RepID=A0A2R6WRE9_MARPO|nr:hypothetical protein MARPO_0064s0101 [Marchantia polymorpha]BBN18247.1 hypothetical protein Mp_8g00970 [Marchantia polymorpha subsp. ruderalis]|eukprot:PTQ36426.1 hypothetical protein MARPO_0064s0101 [Marchantia polymorpha]